MMPQKKHAKSHGSLAQQPRLAQQGLLAGFLDRARDLVYVIDVATGTLVAWNQAVVGSLGYGSEEISRVSMSDVWVSAEAQSWPLILTRLEASAHLLVSGEHRRKDGSTFPVELDLSFIQGEERPYLIGVAREVSERVRREKLLARRSQLTRMQSGINSAVLRIRERCELLREVCRIATGVGGYDRALVALANADDNIARPVFRAGADIDFPEPAQFLVGDGTEPDMSLASRAMRTGEVVVCGDLDRSEPPVALREEVVAQGYKTLVALPLIVEGVRIGCLTLATRDPAPVGEDERLLLQDVTATLSFALRLQQQADRFEFLASYDPLTGLAKRARFCERLNGVLRGQSSLPNTPLVVALDVLHLGDINDSFGRCFGDLLLQQVADRLRRGIDDEGSLGYLGSGTFVLLQPQLLTSEQNINAFLEATVFGERFSIEGHDIRVACRYGVARYPTDGASGDTLVQKAEAALKHARNIGEDYLHYKLEIHSKVAERLALENRLRNAIDAQEFELCYQPQYDIRTGRLEVVEALLRWNDPVRSQVLPLEFLSVLESSGMIVSVGLWVLSTAVRDMICWRRKGLRPCRIAVNVSAIQLRQRRFVSQFLELTAPLRAEQSSWGLDMEITESAMLQDMDTTSHKLRELRASGARVAIDDFGTGYSALGLLAKLPVDMLKIDRSFVQGLPRDAASVTLVRSIIGLASAFGLKSVAEGVETREQLDLLRRLNCDYSQGYLQGRPLNAAGVEKLLG